MVSRRRCVHIDNLEDNSKDDYKDDAKNDAKDNTEDNAEYNACRSLSPCHTVLLIPRIRDVEEEFEERDVIITAVRHAIAISLHEGSEDKASWCGLP